MGPNPRRLHLASAAAERASPISSRLSLPTPSIAVADWVPEAGALRFATWFAEALAPGVRPVVVLTAFGAPPEPPREFVERFEAVAHCVQIRTLDPAASVASGLLAALPTAAVAAPLLLVGEPAVAAFEASLSILIGVDGRGEASLPSLRPWRAATTLCLAQPRQAVAQGLATALRRTLSG